MEQLLKIYRKTVDRLAVTLLAADAIIILLTWSGFYRFQFGSDTLFQIMSPLSNFGGWLDDGRYAAYIMNLLLYHAGILVLEHYRLFFAIFLLGLMVSLFLFQLIFLPFFEDRLRSDPLILSSYICCTSLVFCNVLFSESFMFPECFPNFATAWFLGVLASYMISRGRLVHGMLCVLLAGLFYQVAIVFASMVVSAFLVFKADFVLDRKLIGREILYNMTILLIGFLNQRCIPLAVYLGIIRPEDYGKKITSNYAESLKNYLDESGQLLESSLGILPSVWAPFLVIFLSIATITYVFLRRRERNRIITLVLLFLVEAALLLLLPFLSGHDSLIPRIAVTFYTVQTMFLLGSTLVCNGKHSARLLFCLTGGWLLVQIMFCREIETDRYVSNRLDLTYAQQVVQEIDRYETETGTAVTSVAITNDLYAPNYYDQLRYHRDQINERTMSVVSYSLLEYVNGPGQNLNHVAMDENVYQEYFAEKDWDSFNSKEQLVFVGDTLYWVVF